MAISAGSLEEVFYGFVISMILFGISVTQAWTYLNTNRDRWAIRFWVGIILICNLAHIILVSQVAHYYLMPSAGIATTISSPKMLVGFEWALTGIVQIGVQLYLARVIYLFRKRIWIPAVIAFLCVGLFGIEICTVNDFSLPSHSLEPRQDTAIRPKEDPQTLSTGTRVEMILFHAGVVLVDIIITVSMWNMFLPRNSFVLRTRTVLEKLIIYTVARGLLLTGVRVAHMAAVALKPADIFSWLPSQLLLSNICVVTLLAMSVVTLRCLVSHHLISPLQLERPHDISRDV
ncbi:hypothetical protein BD779DRAFT_1787820 [Infundibulicybe gibba]|nr:hypothetical protein BD779DRAFT_1787820 [Infundibulicybe gibba]